MGIGKILRKLRIEKKMSQVELARQLKITSQALSQYELNKRVPDIEMIEILSDYFNVSTDYLLGRTNIRKDDVIYSSSDKTSYAPVFEDSSNYEFLNDITSLSKESQEEIKKLIELYKIKEMQERNKSKDIKLNKNIK
jgi:transcriptional regulator with XRE-family HTH domain